MQSIASLPKEITGGKNCRWHIADHLSPQKRVCLIWLQSSVKWVINQNQSAALLGKSVERDELAISPHPLVLRLPRLSVPACTCVKEGVLAVSPVLEMVGMMGRCGPTSGLRSVWGSEADTPSRVLVREEPAFRGSDLCCSSRELGCSPRSRHSHPLQPSVGQQGRWGRGCVRASQLSQTRAAGRYVPKRSLKDAA